MEQSHINYDFGIHYVNETDPKRMTNNKCKSIKCSNCNYASSHAGHLRTHMKIHTGEKTNKCNQCDYASSNVSNLRRHLKTHSGEKTNKCNQCDYASTAASHLMRHLKIHSREKQTNAINVILHPLT